MNKYNFKSKMTNIQQYYTIPLPYSVYSRWTQEHSFQVFLITANQLYINTCEIYAKKKEIREITQK